MSQRYENSNSIIQTSIQIEECTKGLANVARCCQKSDAAAIAYLARIGRLGVLLKGVTVVGDW